jgi:hypothetical protein
MKNRLFSITPILIAPSKIDFDARLPLCNRMRVWFSPEKLFKNPARVSEG